MNKIMDKETLENILENPIFYFNEHYIYTDVFKDLTNLKNAIEELKTNKEYSKYKLLFHMIDFKNIYERFRPQTITGYDSYYGTVKLVEKIIESVIRAITEKAIDLLCILKEDTPHYCERIIKEYIQKVLPKVSYENIKFDYKNNKLLINKKILEIGNCRKIILEIYKMKENDL